MSTEGPRGCTQSLFAERPGCREGNRAKKSDVTTELQDESVCVTNAHIDVDAGENVVYRLAYVRVFHPGKEVAWTPDVDSVSSVYRLMFVENRTQGSEWRPILE